MNKSLLVSLLALAMGLAAAPRANAHARLVRSSPERDAVLPHSPSRVELWFNELLEDGFNAVRVFPSAELIAKKQTDFASGKPLLEGRDHTHLSIGLKPLPAGEYVLEWRVLSRDGHSAPGRLVFRVGAKQ